MKAESGVSPIVGLIIPVGGEFRVHTALLEAVMFQLESR